MVGISGGEVKGILGVFSRGHGSCSCGCREVVGSAAPCLPFENREGWITRLSPHRV